VLFAAMPTGASAYIFAVQYKRLVNPVSGAVALGTLLAAVTLPVVVMIVAGVRQGSPARPATSGREYLALSAGFRRSPLKMNTIISP
jgi:hypothetical protein